MLKKVVTCILIVFLVAGTVIPQKTTLLYASDFDTTEVITEDTDSTEKTEDIEYSTTTDDDFDMSDVEILQEDVSQRTANTKAFLRADGTYELAIYSNSVHYYENGEWNDIDNSLSLVDEEYETTANSFKVNFPKSLDESKKIKMTYEDYKIEWSIVGSDSSKIDFDDEEVESSNIKELTNIMQSVIYSDVINNVDIEYVVNGSQVKENIIINKYIEDFSITFEYKVKDLTIIEDDNGDIVFINDDEKIIFSFSDMYMYDKESNYSYDIKYTLVDTGNNTYEITVTPDTEWLETAEYPVVVDPSIESPTDITIEDTYLSFWGNHPSNNYIIFDEGDDQFGYINFTVPSYLQNYEVTYANLNIVMNTQNTDRILLYELSSYDDVTNFTWSSLPTTESDLASYMDVSNLYTTYSIDITNSVSEWNKDGLTSMPGFQLTIKEGSDGPVEVYSVDASSNNPTIEIGYMDTNGIKDYWTYNSQDISYGGTGYISDYTNELYIIRNDIYFETDLQAFGVDFAYNFTEAMTNSTNIGYGIGWNVSYNLMLHYDTSTDEYYTIDYTGNVTYYYKGTGMDSYGDDRMDSTYRYTYIAGDGSGNILVDSWLDGGSTYDETYIITAENIKYSFDTSGGTDTEVYLDGITQIETGLSITIVRLAGYEAKIDYVQDSVGNRIDFFYSTSASNLYYITLQTIDTSSNLNNLERVYYTYSINKLYNVYYLSDYDQDNDLSYGLVNTDKYVNYSLNTTYKRLIVYVRYVDSDGSSYSISNGENIWYYYTSSSDFSISYFQSYYYSYQYSQVTYDDSNNQTLIEDHAGNFVLYSFDTYGHTVNIIDDEGNIQYYDYVDIYHLNNIYYYHNYYLNNSLVEIYSPILPTENVIINPSFESEITYWDVYESSAYAEVETSSAYYKSGNASLIIHNESTSSYGYARQYITLDEGVYTISVDVLNLSTEGANVYAVVNSQYQYASYDTEWQKLTFTLYLNTTTSFYLYLRSYSQGDVYFDNLTFVEGFSDSSVNLISDSSFENSISNIWDQSDSNYINLYSMVYTNNIYEEVLGNYSLALNGKISTSISSSVVEEYLENGYSKIYVGAWALNFAGPIINNISNYYLCDFSILISQYDSNEDWIKTNSVDFKLDYENWQFAYDEINLEDNCSEIEIVLIYSGEGHVVFDDVSVFFTGSKTTYTKDEFGRVTYVNYGNGTEIYYTYDNLENYVQIPETITTYVNDEITSYVENEINDDDLSGYYEIVATTQNNIRISPVYNSYGQMTGYNVGTDTDEDEYFSTSTIYTGLSQYTYSVTDEFGETTTYSTDIVTGLLEHIENSKGDDYYYEYYDDGTLERVYAYNWTASQIAYVTYIYDEYERLVEIQLDSDLSYYITYDSYGRMRSVSVNSQTLMSYDYIIDTYETAIISSQTYGNDDIITFIYDDDYNVIGIQFTDGDTLVETLLYEYVYDSYGRIVMYLDHANKSREYCKCQLKNA